MKKIINRIKEDLRLLKMFHKGVLELEFDDGSHLIITK